MRTAALALAASILAFPADALDFRYGTIDTATVGCRNQEDVYRFVRLMAAGDGEAAGALVKDKFPDCLVYGKGQTVEIERQTTLQYKMTCARLKGQPECRWIPTGFVTPN